jgi:hypothetical protein
MISVTFFSQEQTGRKCSKVQKFFVILPTPDFSRVEHRLNLTALSARAQLTAAVGLQAVNA